MILKSYTRPIDGTIPVQALLYDDEQLLGSQEGVGIYDGQQKSAHHQSGTVYVTTHRLFYYSIQSPDKYSFSFDLAHTTQTDYYAGLFTSSSKVTLHLGSLDDVVDAEDDVAEGWECHLCSYRNPPGTSRNAQLCALCGVPRSDSPQPSPTSKSLPPSRPVTPFSSEIACTACTFLNPTSSKACEICGTPLPGMRSGTAPPSPALKPVSGSDPRLIRVSFRKGGDKNFYAILKRSLQGKAWEKRVDTKRSNTPAFGIDGLLRNAETSAQANRSDMTDTLRDLEAFMVKARDMVHLAQDLNDRLSATTSSATSSSPYSSTISSEPEEATFIRSSLSQLGLQMANAPVTLDMIKDERKWEEQLVRELADVIQGDGSGKGILRGRGIIGLDEVWGGWNRARGMSLIPPSTFLTIVRQLKSYTLPPLDTRTFPNGLTVLHTPEFGERAFSDRIVTLLAPEGGKTASEIALFEDLGLGMTWELIQSVEQHGEIVRDEGGGGGGGWGQGAEVRWWANIFNGYVWDGHIFQDG